MESVEIWCDGEILVWTDMTFTTRLAALEEARRVIGREILREQQRKNSGSK